MKGQRIALATVSSDDFAIGTLVMLWSFGRANPWFEGDVHVFADALSDENRALIKEAAPRARFEAPSDAFVARLNALIAERPELADRRARFLSVETFRLAGYDRLLFCDSDLLFTGSIAPLFSSDGALIACPDGAALRAAGRDARTFSRQEEGASASFNAGLMVIDSARLGLEAYDQLLGSIDSRTWREMATHHTDQFLLNRAFGDISTLAGAGYNLLLSHRAATFRREGVRVDDAVVLHFNGPAKPWRTEAMLSAARLDAGLLPAWRLWQEALESIVAEGHLHRAGR